MPENRKSLITLIISHLYGLEHHRRKQRGLAPREFPLENDSHFASRKRKLQLVPSLAASRFAAMVGTRSRTKPRHDVRRLTSGAAPLIVCTFRRVRRGTSTDAFQTCDAGRAGVHLPSETVQRTRPSGALTRNQAGARPYLRRPLGSGRQACCKIL